MNKVNVYLLGSFVTHTQVKVLVHCHTTDPCFIDLQYPRFLILLQMYTEAHKTICVCLLVLNTHNQTESMPEPKI